MPITARTAPECLIGAIEHLGARRAITQAQCKEWIRIAIRETGADNSSGLFGGFMCIEHFNDTRSSYVEVAEVLARARALATAHAKKMAAELRLTAPPKEPARLPAPVRAKPAAAPARVLPKIPAPPPQFALPAPPQVLALPYEVRIEQPAFAKTSAAKPDVQTPQLVPAAAKATADKPVAKRTLR